MKNGSELLAEHEQNMRREKLAFLAKCYGPVGKEMKKNE